MRRIQHSNSTTDFITQKKADKNEGGVSWIGGREQLGGRSTLGLNNSAFAADVNKIYSTPQLAAVGVLDSNGYPSSSRAEAFLCDADAPPPPPESHPERREEDSSAALVDRIPPALADPRRSSSRALLQRRLLLQQLQQQSSISSSSCRLGSDLSIAKREYGALREQQQQEKTQRQQQAESKEELQQEFGGQQQQAQLRESMVDVSGEQPSLSAMEASVSRAVAVRSFEGDDDDASSGDGDRPNQLPNHHNLCGNSHSWMDAGSIWSSVQQRHGEELQRRKREQELQLGHQQRQPRSSARQRRRLPAAAASCIATLGAWRHGPCRRFLQRLRTQMIVTARVAAKDPCTVVVPLCLLVCMLALGMWGVFSVASAIGDGRRQSAFNAATDFAAALKSHIAATMAPASTLKTLIELDPRWEKINATFHERAPSLVKKGLVSDAILTIVLCPQAIASAIVPTGLPAWDKVYGLDLLREPAWRNDALKTIRLHEEGMVMTGPSRLRAGMMGIVTRYAVFVPGAPDDTFGFTGGTAYNCSICYQPSIDGASQGMRFWGFAQLNVDWEVLLRNVTRLYDLCGRDGLSFNMSYIDPVTFANRSIAACGRLGPNPLVVPIDTMQNHWELAVYDTRGWSPDWLPLVVAVVVVVSLWVAGAMAVILVNRREHMWLLQAMLPKKVIATLRRGEEYVEAFECVTVLFSDIVSYTTLASEMEPIKVVRLLNEMYSEFDALVDQFECYKVETIGDAFMAVCGTQGEDPVASAVKVARLAQAMIERTHVLESADGQKIQIRIGLHSGPVVGAVVGFKMPHFCLCGDTVNTASRMESNSAPMRVHISDSTAALLTAAAAASVEGPAGGGGGFRLARRGTIQVKGKGPMMTHWLLLPSEVEAEEVESGGAGGDVPPPAVYSSALTTGDGSERGEVSLELTATAAETVVDAAAVAAAEATAAAAAAARSEILTLTPSPTAAAFPDMRSLHTSISGTPPPSVGAPGGAATVAAFAAAAVGSGGSGAAAAIAFGSLSTSPSMGRPAGIARHHRFSEAGPRSVGGGGGPRGGIPSYLTGPRSNGGGSGSGLMDDGGSGGGAISVSCSGGAAAAAAAPRRPRASVDLRLFQPGPTRHSSRGK